MSHTCAHTKPARSGLRIWQGRRKQLGKNRVLYEAGTRPFVSWVSDLYSFANMPLHSGARKELIGLAPEILAYAQTHFTSEHNHVFGGDSAEDADVISTVLAWLSLSVNPCYDVYDEYVAAAKKTIAFGRALLKDEPSIQHTALLLMLTEMDMYLRYGSQEEGRRARILLWLVFGNAAYVADPCQRSRIYRKLGMFFRRIGNMPLSRLCGLQSISAEGIPLAVRLKGIAGFLGFGS